jgi:DNA topoisomerase VI subunit A
MQATYHKINNPIDEHRRASTSIDEHRRASTSIDEHRRATLNVLKYSFRDCLRMQQSAQVMQIGAMRFATPVKPYSGLICASMYPKGQGNELR